MPIAHEPVPDVSATVPGTATALAHPSDSDASPAVAASYARKSTFKDTGLAEQHSTNTTRATRDGAVVPSAYQFGDDAISGKTTSREGLDEVLELIRSGSAPFKRIYIRDRDRLARASDPRFAMWFEYECKLHGVQVCYATDAHHLEFGDERSANEMAGYITGAVQNVQAFDELRAIRERTRRGMLNTLKDGYYVNSEAPYGFRRCLVNRSTKAFVREIPQGETVRMAGHSFGLRLHAGSLAAIQAIFVGIVARKCDTAIARELNEGKYPTPASGPWIPSIIRQIARNPIYMGDYVFKRELPGTPIPYSSIDSSDPVDRPIIPRELWLLANEILDSRAAVAQQAKASHPRYLLTRLLTCSYCGSNLFGHRQIRRVKTNARVTAYRHHPLRSKGAVASGESCPFVNRYVRAEPLEEAALEATARFLESGEIVAIARATLREMERSEKETSAVESMDEAEARFKRAESAALEANIRAARAASLAEKAIHDATMKLMIKDMDDAQTHMQHLREKAADLAKALERIPKLEAELAILRNTFREGSPEAKKRVVAAVIERMDIDLSTDTVTIRVRAA